MSYTIDWVGTVALGVKTEGGRQLAFSLEEGQTVPEEFQEGDLVEIANNPGHPAEIARGMGSSGYYEFTHLKTGKTFRTMHRADMYKLDDDMRNTG